MTITNGAESNITPDKVNDGEVSTNREASTTSEKLVDTAQKVPNRMISRISVAVFGIAAFLAAGFALKRPILEQWYIWELGSEDKALRKRAADNLGEMKSVRVLPQLIKLFREEASTVSQALVRIGRPAVPALIRELKDQDGDRTSAAGTLSSIGPEARDAVPVLIETLRRQDDWQWAARDNCALAR